MKKHTTTPQQDSGMKKYVPYGINGMYYIYDNDLHFMLPGQAGSSSRRMIKRKCEQLNAEEAQTQPTKEVLQDKHTPGEWKTEYQQYADEQDSTDTHICVAAANGDWIADCGPEGNEESEANAELIVKAVNNYQSLVDENGILKEARNVLCQLVKDMADSNKELLEKLNELHHYTDHKVKSYNIKDSMYFSVINIMANGLHNKFKQH
jgi:hypothetical protein